MGQEMNADLNSEKADLLAEYQKRWEQDNGSLVFYPLAEAYRKAGQLEQAIQLCQQGLANYPDYWSARVVLGRAYMEQGLLDEAKAELEKVVKIVPNNLLASKTLAQIYILQEDLAKAAQCYETITNFYPQDEELAEQYNYLLKVEVPAKKKYLETLEQWREAVKILYSSPAEADI